MKRFLFTFLFLSCIVSCKKEIQLIFEEQNTLYDTNAIIEINIPEAQGNSIAAKGINNKIRSHIANSLNFSEIDDTATKLSQSIERFNSEFIDFKERFGESSLVWEATFDGEIMYQSPEVLSISLTSYINTGGAHGNSIVKVFNFNPKNGYLLEFKDLIINKGAFSTIAKQFFTKEVALKSSEDITDFFYGKDFELPENIGYNEEGLLLLYNTYEIASYSMGITEFTIPYSEINSLLLKR